MQRRCPTISRHTPRMGGIQYAAASRFDLDVYGILDRPLEPVIGLAEGETRWRAMTVGGGLAFDETQFQIKFSNSRDGAFAPRG